ncbi:MAG TPA: FxDxF family PEP-CTERM protein [Rubrivivax sp.]|nr:FxDxF family PEP-CTERM protein [Rubrivivax sp.]
MKFTRLAAVAALAVASSSGYAISLGNIDVSSGTAAFSNTPIAGSFTDTLTFNVTTASFFTGTLTSVVSGNQDIDFTTVSLMGPSGTFAYTMALADPVETWTRTSVQLAPGMYTLTMAGTNSPSIASYAGTLGVTPVPEAGTVAMMLAGLGIVGFMARRRQA